MSKEQRRKKAIRKAEFLRAYRDDEDLDFDALIVIDEHDDCWTPAELLESLSPEERAMSPKGQAARRKMLSDVDARVRQQHRPSE